MVRSIPQLEALRDEWHALAAPRRSPLAEHDWFMSCAEAFRGDLRVVTAWEGGRLTGVAPLVLDGEKQPRRLTLLGASRLYEPGDWLYESVLAAEELTDRALAIGLPLVLQRVPEGSDTVGAIHRRRRRALTAVRPAADSLAVRTDGAWGHYASSLSSHTTTNLRRVRKKAEAALGPMRVERVNPAPPQVDALLESFATIEGSGWKGRAGSSLASRADLKDFFRGYAHRLAERRHLQVARLWFGSHLAAAELSVDAYDRMWQLKIGYHEALSAFYPGLHLTGASIEDAFARGLQAYEFLGSAAPWEERWKPESRRFRAVVAYPITLGGLAGAAQDVLGHLWRHRPGMGIRGARRTVGRNR